MCCAWQMVCTVSAVAMISTRRVHGLTGYHSETSSSTSCSLPTCLSPCPQPAVVYSIPHTFSSTHDSSRNYPIHNNVRMSFCRNESSIAELWYSATVRCCSLCVFLCLQRFQKRYFVLDQQRLMYFEKPTVTTKAWKYLYLPLSLTPSFSHSLPPLLSLTLSLSLHTLGCISTGRDLAGNGG